VCSFFARADSPRKFCTMNVDLPIESWHREQLKIHCVLSGATRFHIDNPGYRSTDSLNTLCIFLGMVSNEFYQERAFKVRITKY